MTRCRWRAWPSPRCFQLHSTHVIAMILTCMNYTYSCGWQRWTYNWNRHFLNAVVHPWFCWLGWRIPDALGPRFCAVILRSIHLARIRHHVSPKWRRKGLSGGRIYPPKVLGHSYFCGKRYCAWFYSFWVHSKCRLSLLHRISILQFTAAVRFCAKVRLA